MPSQPKPRKSVLVIARLITAIVGLAGAEGVLWFGGFPSWWAMDPSRRSASAEYEADPDLGWRTKEGQYDLASPGLREGAVRNTNWSGGRRATGTQSAGSAKPQVLFFGDSYIQGYGLSDQETLPWIVQQHHPEVEVSNYGAGSYGTYQCYLAMNRA